ncbi:hypothetical protein L0337_20385 [candidate division KSB1 bacterium]|nr:hypothetical protein [candidate division KSB1 bacterium]
MKPEIPTGVKHWRYLIAGMKLSPQGFCKVLGEESSLSFLSVSRHNARREEAKRAKRSKKGKKGFLPLFAFLVLFASTSTPRICQMRRQGKGDNNEFAKALIKPRPLLRLSICAFIIRTPRSGISRPKDDFIEMADCHCRSFAFYWAFYLSLIGVFDVERSILARSCASGLVERSRL